MNLRNLKMAIFICVFSFAGLGCVQQKPEGPAERIGKGIDEISDALRDYDARSSDSARSRDLSHDYGRDQYGEERVRSYDHDPYYDSPSDDDAYAADKNDENNQSEPDRDYRDRSRSRDSRRY